MIFRPELAAKVMAGEKTATRRLVSDNPRKRCRLTPLDSREAEREGFADVLAFREAWVAINGTWDGESMVWRIGLRVML